MKSAAEQIQSFLRDAAVEAPRRHAMSLMFALSMQCELEAALADWRAAVAMIRATQSKASLTAAESN